MCFLFFFSFRWFPVNFTCYSTKIGRIQWQRILLVPCINCSGAPLLNFAMPCLLILNHQLPLLLLLMNMQFLLWLASWLAMWMSLHIDFPISCSGDWPLIKFSFVIQTSSGSGTISTHGGSTWPAHVQEEGLAGGLSNAGISQADRPHTISSGELFAKAFFFFI